MKAFDNSEFEKYKTEAKEKWGNTDAYKEYSEKTKDYSAEKQNSLTEAMDAIMTDFSQYMKEGYSPYCDEVQELVGTLQRHITENYYTCTKEILYGLGQMYVADERFRSNIDKHGKCTAQFISSAIRAYCGK